MSHTHLTAPTHFVEVNGDRLAYRRRGNTATDQPPLFFLQHYRGGMDHWDPLMTDGLAAVASAQIEANLHYLPRLQEDDPFANLRGIRQPTFILNGVNDAMVANVNSFYMARNLPNAQLFIYPDAGHAAQFQCPQRFLHHAVQFLAE